MNDRGTNLQPQTVTLSSDLDAVKPPTEIKSPSAHSWRRYAGVVTVVIILVCGGWWLFQQFTHVFVNDARIAADMIAISSRVPGWVTAVEIIEGDRLKQKELLIAIDSRESRLLIKEFDARLTGIMSHREEINARIRMIDRQTASGIEAQQAAMQVAQATLAAAIAQRDLTQLENSRSERLVDSGAVSRARLDQTRAAFETAHQQVLSAQANLQNARAGLAQTEAAREELNVLERQLAELGPEEQQLRAEQERAQLDLQDRTITMPFDGVVDRVFVDSGEYVTPGQRLLMVHDSARIRVEANVKETDIRFFQLGKTVTVTVDALPGRTFNGTVERIGQAATSEFSLLPNPNPSGNFTKITQRLPVRLSLLQQENLLKPGMMVELRTRTRE